MQSISPVFTETEIPFETTISMDQPQYLPVIALPISIEARNEENGEATMLKNMMLAVRMELSDEERASVAAGADLVVTQLSFNRPFTPLHFQFCKTGEKPAF